MKPAGYTQTALSVRLEELHALSAAGTDSGSFACGLERDNQDWEVRVSDADGRAKAAESLTEKIKEELRRREEDCKASISVETHSGIHSGITAQNKSPSRGFSLTPDANQMTAYTATWRCPCSGSSGTES